jgi:hypothetical protein
LARLIPLKEVAGGLARYKPAVINAVVAAIPPDALASVR